MKIIKITLKTIFTLFCISLIITGALLIIKQNNSISIAEELVSNIDTSFIDDNESNNVRERDPFSTDYGEDYYWGLDDDLEIDVEIKESSTLNQKQTGNYYMSIDFEKLKQEYPNMIGYLKVNGTNVEYPIVQGEDNAFYLKHDINDEYSVIGWPFANHTSDISTMSGNITIYGHNIKNKTMFGELTKLLDVKDWFNDSANKEIYFVTETHSYVYKIFSVYNSSPTFNYGKNSFISTQEFNSFINILKDKNKVKALDTDFTPTQIITLSTCYNSGRQRMVVQAYLERTKNIK